MRVITISRKPFKGSLVDNVLENQCGSININQTRIGTTGGRTNKGGYQNTFVGGSVDYSAGKGVEGDKTPRGRWGANFVFSPCVAFLFPNVNSQAKCKTDNKSGWQTEYVGGSVKSSIERTLYVDAGSSSKFFKEIKDD
jgi:hypothetical protein